MEALLVKVSWVESRRPHKPGAGPDRKRRAESEVRESMVNGGNDF